MWRSFESQANASSASISVPGQSAVVGKVGRLLHERTIFLIPYLRCSSQLLRRLPWSSPHHGWTVAACLPRWVGVRDPNKKSWDLRILLCCGLRCGACGKHHGQLQLSNPSSCDLQATEHFKFRPSEFHGQDAEKNSSHSCQACLFPIPWVVFHEAEIKKQSLGE